MKVFVVPSGINPDIFAKFQTDQLKIIDENQVDKNMHKSLLVNHIMSPLLRAARQTRRRQLDSSLCWMLPHVWSAVRGNRPIGWISPFIRPYVWPALASLVSVLTVAARLSMTASPGSIVQCEANSHRISAVPPAVIWLTIRMVPPTKRATIIGACAVSLSGCSMRRVPGTVCIIDGISAVAPGVRAADWWLICSYTPNINFYYPWAIGPVDLSHVGRDRSQKWHMNETQEEHWITA
jgi:hypothetical protein